MPDREVLTFRPGNESYAVDLLKVQEIRGVDRVTQIPKSHRTVSTFKLDASASKMEAAHAARPSLAARVAVHA